MTTGKLDKQAAEVGFIGLGLMGSRLAKRLHDAGWKLKAWNRNPERAQAAGKQGLTLAASLQELVANSDVLLSCLANDVAVRAVYLEDGGVLSLARPGTIILEMSTISAALSREVHHRADERGIRLLDLAIAGSTPAVEAGTVTLLAGGDMKTFDQCTPIYEALAKQWFLIGPASSGVQMKLVVNLLLGVGMQAIAEAISLGKHLQIDSNVLLDVLSKTAVIPPAFAGKFRKIKNDDYSPEFPLRLMSKDMNLVVDAATSTGAKLPAAEATQQFFAAHVATIGDLDLSAVAPIIAGSAKSKA